MTAFVVAVNTCRSPAGKNTLRQVQSLFSGHRLRPSPGRPACSTPARCRDGNAPTRRRSSSRAQQHLQLACPGLVEQDIPGLVVRTSRDVIVMAQLENCRWFAGGRQLASARNDGRKGGISTQRQKMTRKHRLIAGQNKLRVQSRVPTSTDLAPTTCHDKRAENTSVE